MSSERLQLHGADRRRYFAPVFFCGCLAAVCVMLMLTAAFVVDRRDAIAVTVTGGFGLMLSAALGAGILCLQRLELRYLCIPTAHDADSNFELVERLAQASGWQITSTQRGRQLIALTRGTLLQRGEMVAVQFRQQAVLVASICDPSVGFSLIGRRQCIEHRERVRRAVLREIMGGNTG